MSDRPLLGMSGGFFLSYVKHLREFLRRIAWRDSFLQEGVDAGSAALTTLRKGESHYW